MTFILYFINLIILTGFCEGGHIFVRHEKTGHMGSRDLQFANSYYLRTFGRRMENPISFQSNKTSPLTSYAFLKKSYRRPLFSWDAPIQKPFLAEDTFLSSLTNKMHPITKTIPTEFRHNHQKENPVSYRTSYVYMPKPNDVTSHSYWTAKATDKKKKRKKKKCKGLTKEECKRLKEIKKKSQSKNAEGNDVPKFNREREPTPSCQQRCDHFCSFTNNQAHCSCKEGFTLVNGFRCEDIDECALNNGGCEGPCLNTLGSRKCLCPIGFKLSVDSNQCSDINECDEANGGCSQICHNTVGSRECKCELGYLLRSDGVNCTDIDECAQENGRCDHKCINSEGSYLCECEQGFTLTDDFLKCTDIDECLENTGGCSQECVNSQGSFSCACEAGFILSKDQKNCEDIDECLIENGKCSQSCTNSNGTFECSCWSGYSKTLDDCVDINECLENNGGCFDICKNEIGSFECSCQAGYELAENEINCVDINECNNENVCPHECINTDGSYFCSCQPGYTLALDNSTCEDINECLNEDICAYECINTDGSYTCTCQTGYTLSLDNSTCEDINECLSENGGCFGKCLNTEGSRQCTCDYGYILDSNGVNCVDVNECLTDNGNCSQECVNFIGSWQCLCRKGYQFTEINNSTCKDTNECETLVNACEQDCYNTEGSYLCGCKDGFELSNNKYTCVDIDECQRGIFNCTEEETCLNTIGSAKCVLNDVNCSIGYGWNGTNCTDINECLEKDGLGPCEYGCTNTIGGYICFCDKENGFELRADKLSCEEIIEEVRSSSQAPNDCEMDNAGCSHVCEFSSGHVYCTCPDGWELGNDWKTCQDIDECEDPEEYEVTCPDQCINEIGSYKCDKPDVNNFRYKIVCPDDMVAELAPDESKAELILDKPETNLNWERDIQTNPSWGKNETVKLAVGIYEMRYSFRNDSSIQCTVVIEVIEGQAPQIVVCPDSKTIKLEFGQTTVDATWEEPEFDDNVEVSEVIAAPERGTKFGVGHHTVTYTAIDDVGFETDCSFSIDVLPF